MYKDRRKQLDYVNNWLKQRRLKWVNENGPCVDCGSWKKLEVDHIDPKLKKDHRIWSLREEKRNEELSKCCVRCHACHKRKTRIQTYGTPDHGRVSKYFQGCRCKLCKRRYDLKLDRQKYMWREERMKTVMKTCEICEDEKPCIQRRDGTWACGPCLQDEWASTKRVMVQRSSALTEGRKRFGRKAAFTF